MIRAVKVTFVTCLVLCLPPSPVAAQTDPSVAGQWASLAPLPFYPTALHLLPTGMVMFYAGNSSEYPGTDPRLWDPATGTTTPLAQPGYDLFAVATRSSATAGCCSRGDTSPGTWGCRTPARSTP